MDGNKDSLIQKKKLPENYQSKTKPVQTSASPGKLFSYNLFYK